MIYEYSGRRYPVPAQVVGETVERLAKANEGVCPPASLVDEARPEDSPLHPLFTWEDDVAAERWRRHEARNVIRAIRVTREESRAKTTAFYHVKTEEEEPKEGYAPQSEVVKNVDWHQQAVNEALTYLRGFRRRYRHLNELAPVMDAIAEVVGDGDEEAA